MIFLTVNDSPSGVYKSQVVDVVHCINELSSTRIKLVAFISIRNFFENRRQIRSWYKGANVFPMVPGIKRWKMNLFLLRFVRRIKSEKIIARGVMAFYLAHRLNKRVVYDGRGAVRAELDEFPEMIPDVAVRDSLKIAERIAVQSAVFRIAVSNKLVDYWHAEMNYTGSDHVVIPCVVSVKNEPLNSEKQKREREALGFKEDDIVLIYSGGVAGWQSFKQIEVEIQKWMNSGNIKILFLSKETPEIMALMVRFPDSVFQQWLQPDRVQDVLQCGDYGILIREDNITNRVSSPVKFGEYLAAGLKVIIAPNIGDFSDLVTENALGELLSGNAPVFKRTTTDERSRTIEFALKNLSKESFKPTYKILLDQS